MELLLAIISIFGGIAIVAGIVFIVKLISAFYLIKR